ncbi:MAG: hypothetical protein ACF8PN_00245 [Phycisphaerales bacterium]
MSQDRDFNPEWRADAEAIDAELREFDRVVGDRVRAADDAASLGLEDRVFASSVEYLPLQEGEWRLVGGVESPGPSALPRRSVSGRWVIGAIAAAVAVATGVAIHFSTQLRPGATPNEPAFASAVDESLDELARQYEWADETLADDFGAEFDVESEQLMQDLSSATLALSEWNDDDWGTDTLSSEYLDAVTDLSNAATLF